MERGWGAKLLLLCCSTQIRGENQKKGSLVGDWECKRGGWCGTAGPGGICMRDTLQKSLLPGLEGLLLFLGQISLCWFRENHLSEGEI